MINHKVGMQEKQGSMTVEAALVMPLFLFTLITIISLFEMINVHTMLDSALQRAGREISTYAYTTEGYESVLLSEAYVKERVINIVGRERINDSIVEGGTAGIVLWRTKVEDEDVIDLVMTYRVSPRLNFFRFNDMVLINRCYIKAYTGYEKQELSEDERKYYMADTGEVYHLSRTCSHLQLTICLIDVNQLENARNESGSRYKPCEICYNSEVANEKLYITTQGERYHVSVSCIGLKRTVYVIGESQLGGRVLCTRCMKEIK